MVLCWSFGASSGPFDIRSVGTYTLVTSGQTARGSNIIPVGGLVIGDLYKLTLRVLLSTSATANTEFFIYFGTERACSFPFAIRHRHLLVLNSQQH